MATGFLGLPTALELSRDSLRRIATVINGILAGKQNNVTTLTLTASSATTTFQDPRIGAGSHLAFTPLTANAEKAIIGQGGLIGVRVFTTPGSQTYTPTTGTDFVVMELLGAGAGGAGVSSPGVGKTSIGGGGTGGMWGLKRLTADFSGGTLVIGAKGTGGTAGANPGNVGGATTFTTTAPSSTLYSVYGGSGGGSASAGTPPFFVGNNTGANGAFSNNFDIWLGAFGAIEGVSLSTAASYSGAGGTSRYGTGGAPRDVVTAAAQGAGQNGVGYGSGGSGATANTTGTAQAGGDGTDGLAIFWEYSYGGVGGMYVSSRGKQTATITHANNSQSDRTFSVEITG